MRQFSLREITVSHFMTVLGVVLIASAMGSSFLGRAAEPLASATPSAMSSGQSDSGSMERYLEPETVRPDTSPSTRGSRGSSSNASQAEPTASPEPATAPTGTPAPSSAPTATPSPTPSSPPLRVGIQAGHWKNSELPGELAGLRGSTGAAGMGWSEVEVNLDIARRVVALLQKENLLVDLIPATVPSQYKADAFVSLHGDANSNTSLSGYKLARARWSRIPDKEDALLRSISNEYRAATGLRDHPATITNNMLAYYAFNYHSLDHAVAPTTPSAILEMGFLTTLSDRKLLKEQPDRIAQGVANGILKFLGRR